MSQRFPPLDEKGESVPARPASTVVLVRDGDGGVEVFMLQRDPAVAFAGGSYVFPGGAVDETDHAAGIEELCVGYDDARASSRLGLDFGGLAYWVAGIRECFEEAGVLLAYDGSGRLLDAADPGPAVLEDHRQRLMYGGTTLEAVCRELGVTLATDRMHYLSHWITPEMVPKRFDTRFFLAEAMPGQTARHCEQETVAHCWIAPDAALAANERGELEMMPPTIHTLRSIRGYEHAAELVAEVEARAEIPAVQPRIVRDADGIRVLMPGEPGYDDAE